MLKDFQISFLKNNMPFFNKLNKEQQQWFVDNSIYTTEPIPKENIKLIYKGSGENKD